MIALPNIDWIQILAVWIWPILSGVTTSLVVVLLLYWLQRPVLDVSIANDQYNPNSPSHYVHLKVKNISKPFLGGGTAKIVMQPARYKILQLLLSSDKPLFVEQISDETKIHARMVSHHVDVLQQQGVVASKYEIVKKDGSKRGVAVRMCEATPHAKEVMRDIKESI